MSEGAPRGRGHRVLKTSKTGGQAPAGDRDGDGDADLLSLFYSDTAILYSDVAFVSGSSTRLGGPQPLPIRWFWWGLVTRSRVAR